MMVQFLSEAWFDMVTAETNNMGDLHLSPAMQKIHLNVKIKDEENKGFYLSDGSIANGIDDEAPTTVVVPKKLLVEMAEELSTSIALQAFVEGDVKVLGDISQLMILQTARISEEQKQLFAVILQKTQMSD